MNHCAFGGSIVSPSEWLPADPFDYDFGRSGPLAIGCNTLRCGECGADVRSRPGLRVRGGALDAGTAYGTPDWASLPEVATDDAYRLYVCRCRWAAVDRAQPLDHPALDERTFRSKWRCSGHEALPTPATVDGVSVPGGDVAAVLADPASFAPVGVDADAAGLAFPVVRAFFVVDGAGAGWVSRAVADCLASSSDAVRVGALQFFSLVGDAPGFDVVTSLAASSPELFDGSVEVQGRKRTLSKNLHAALIAGARDGSSAARDAARAEALRPGRAGASLLWDLASVDGSWLLDHAADVAAATPAQAVELVGALKSAAPGALAGALAAVASADGVDASEIADEVREVLDEPARSAVLEHLPA